MVDVGPLSKSEYARVALLVCLSGLYAPATFADELADLKAILERQQQQIEEQAQRQRAQEERIRELEAANRALQQRAADEAPVLVQEISTGTPAVSGPDQRDAIGDMNARAISEGRFPGSVLLTGRRLPVSLGIGGYIKSVAYEDSDYENDDPLFFPALLGFGRKDRNGNFGHSAELSRIYLDARADSGKGDIRGYVEWDFRDDFNLRHAYMDWSGRHGALRAGRYWSALMDVSAVPKGVTEASVSGIVFARQEQIRFTKPVGERWAFVVSAEDPASNDVQIDDDFTPQTNSPDMVATVRWDTLPGLHFQLGGVYRHIEVDSALLQDDSTTGWGAQLTSSWQITEADRLMGGVLFGDGLGRYMLGLGPFAGGYVDDGKLKSRKSRGFYGSYARRWSEKWSSNLSYGYARSETEDPIPNDSFKNSQYFGVNLFYEIVPYLSIGLEYNWGERENVGGSSLDNHRVMLGFQLF